MCPLRYMLAEICVKTQCGSRRRGIDGRRIDTLWHISCSRSGNRLGTIAGHNHRNRQHDGAGTSTLNFLKMSASYRVSIWA